MKTKKAPVQIRYNTLDRCFRNPGQKYDIHRLVEECNNAIYEFSKKDGVKKRQLYDDIRFMESEQGWNIELVKDKVGRKSYYRYEDQNFSISNQPLNETEANQLKEALSTLSRFKGLPQFDWIEELKTRLDSRFSLNSSVKNVISFEQNEHLFGLEFISLLYNSIVYKKVLSIDYKKFESETHENYTFHPYYLKQYNLRWFLFGKCEGYETLTNLPLDRIENIQEIQKTYIEADFDFNKYFDDIIGVTRFNANVENVILEVDKSLMPYLQTKIIHVSQDIKEIDNRFQIHLKVIPNHELEALILSFGEKVKVLEPKSLVEKLKDRISKMKNNY